MHELGICDALLKMVRGIMKDEELTEVEKITVEVGSLSGVVPKFLADCLETTIKIISIGPDRAQTIVRK